MKKLNLALVLLLAIAAPGAAQRRALPTPPEKSVHWATDDSRCEVFLSDGDYIRFIRDGDLTVAAVGYDSGGYTVVEVTVGNASAERVDVIPGDFFLTYQNDQGKFGYEYSLPPEKVASKITGRAKWGNFFRSFVAGMARTTTEESGSLYIRGPNGETATGTYSGAMTRPDARAQEAARERNAQASRNAAEKSAQLLDAALKANTLLPKTYVSGLVYFERSKYKVANLNMIIGGTLYSFTFR